MIAPRERVDSSRGNLWGALHGKVMADQTRYKPQIIGQKSGMALPKKQATTAVIPNFLSKLITIVFGYTCLEEK